MRGEGRIEERAAAFEGSQPGGAHREGAQRGWAHRDGSQRGGADRGDVQRGGAHRARGHIRGSPLDGLAGRRVLMLQGPAGPFFRRVARQLAERGATVWKVNFNAADGLFFRGPRVVHFREPFEAWPRFFSELVEREAIEAIVLFGDMRPLHRAAIEECERRGIDVFVFEEGYLRPDFVTLERGGVAGCSSIPKDPSFFRSIEPAPEPEPHPVGNVLPRAAIYAVIYACTHGLTRWRYPHYRHHRCIRPFHQAFYWSRGGIRRVRRGLRDRDLDARIENGAMAPFYLVPLQVHLDSQMRHCRFESIEAFVEEVVRSFAEHAPAGSVLLLKDHPLGRPYRDYTHLVDRLRDHFGLDDRIVYCDVIHLPTALRRAEGTVTINSTVGLSSIHHGTPVKCLGKAVYDMAGLTHQGDLDGFWVEPEAVDGALYRRFRSWLRENNQINGSVWRELWL